MKQLIFLLVLLFVPLISASSLPDQYCFDYNDSKSLCFNSTAIESEGPITFNQNISAPNLGSLSVNVNSTQFESNDPITLNMTWLTQIFTGIFNSVYCKLTGCVMTGNINFSNAGIYNTNYVKFNTTFSDGHEEGRLQWNIDDGTLEIGMPGNNVNLQIGEEMLIRATNDAGVEIPNGKLVYISGGSGANVYVKVASNNNLSISTPIGMATENIASGQKGYVTTRGLVRDINTSGMTVGSTLWLGTNGTYTTTKPTAPNYSSAIGVVIREHATEGVIYVVVNNLYTMQTLSSNYGIPTTTGQFYAWNNTTQRFELDNTTNYAKYQFGSNNFVGTGNFTTSGNITASYLCEYGGSCFNISILNQSGSGSQTPWLSDIDAYNYNLNETASINSPLYYIGTGNPGHGDGNYERTSTIHNGYPVYFNSNINMYLFYDSGLSIWKIGGGVTDDPNQAYLFNGGATIFGTYTGANSYSGETVDISSTGNIWRINSAGESILKGIDNTGLVRLQVDALGSTDMLAGYDGVVDFAGQKFWSFDLNGDLNMIYGNINDNNGATIIDPQDGSLNEGTTQKFNWRTMQFPTLTTNGFVTTTNGDGTLAIATDVSAYETDPVYTSWYNSGSPTLNTLNFATQASITDDANYLILNGNNVDVRLGGTSTWIFSSGSFYPTTGNLQDLGTVTNTVKDGYFGGTVTAGTLTDGTASLSSGALTGLVSATDGTASWSSNSLSGFTSISGTTLTDGTCSMSGGAISSCTSVTATTVGDGTCSITGGSLSGCGGVSDTYDDGVDTTITFTNGLATGISTAFDSRLMQNVTYLNNVNTSKYLTPVKFLWSSDGLKQYPTKTALAKVDWQTGYIAQDVQKFYPNCIVYENKTLSGTKPVQYMNYNRNCVAYYLGIDNANNQIKYETQIANIEARLSKLEGARVG